MICKCKCWTWPGRLWVWGLAWANEFQGSQSYTARACSKNPNPQTNNSNKGKIWRHSLRASPPRGLWITDRQTGTGQFWQSGGCLWGSVRSYREQNIQGWSSDLLLAERSWPSSETQIFFNRNANPLSTKSAGKCACSYSAPGQQHCVHNEPWLSTLHL